MKKVILTLLMAMLLTALPFSFGFGQEGAPEAPKDIFFGGLSYDDGLALQGGYGGPVIQDVIAGGDLYAWFVLELGLSPDVTGEDSLFNVGAGGLEASLLFGEQSFWYGIVLNAVKLDWLSIQNGGAPDWSSYVSNLIGVTAGGKISGRVGAAVRLNYSFDYTTSLFPDGPAIDAYLYLTK